MFGFFRSRRDELPLDEELKKQEAGPPPPPVKYIYTIHSESETFSNSVPITYEEAYRTAQNLCVHGTALLQDGKLTRWLPPHRIYEITFEEQE